MVVPFPAQDQANLLADSAAPRPRLPPGFLLDSFHSSIHTPFIGPCSRHGVAFRTTTQHGESLPSSLRTDGACSAKQTKQEGSPGRGAGASCDRTSIVDKR